MLLVVGAVSAIALWSAHSTICKAVAVEFEATGLLAVASHGLFFGLLTPTHLLPNIFDRITFSLHLISCYKND